MARITNAMLLERIATLEAALASKPAATTEASAHYVAADLPCPVKGAACKDKDGNVKTFRTVKGQTWHRENAHKA